MRSARIGYALVVAAILGVTSAANADLLYSNTNQTGFRYNPGNQHITFDDAPIALAALAGNNAVSLTSVGVGIRRITAAPATDVTIYTAAFDTNFNIVTSSITNLGTFSLGANAASVTQIVTATVAVPYEVPLVFTANYGYMAVGVQISETTSGLNGWRITNNMAVTDIAGDAGKGTNVAGSAPNINLFWDIDQNTMAQTVFSFGFTGANQSTNPPASFYSVINGRPVPEPSSIAAIGAALMGLAGLKLRRR